MSRKVSTVALPFSNVKLHSHKSVMKGSGNGSVLLRSGGPGAGSSYTDMDDYIATTCINPYTRSTSGKGLADRLGKKLSNLNIEKKAASELPKKKKIVMSV